MSAGPSPSERDAARALERRGFTGVRFLPPTGEARCADLLARRGGVLYAVEIRSSTRPLRADATFEPAEPGKPLPYPALSDYFALLWREKREQLETTAAAHGCVAALLLVAVDGTPTAGWRDQLARAWSEAGSPLGVSFALWCADELIAHPPLPPA